MQPLQGAFDPADARPSSYSSRRYEQGGQLNIPAVLGIGSAIAFHEAIGPEHIAARVLDLTGRLRAGLATIPGVKVWRAGPDAWSSNLTTFTVAGVPGPALARALHENAGIYISGRSPANHSTSRQTAPP